MSKDLQHYRERYHRTLHQVVWMSVLCIVLVLVLAGFSLMRQQPNYYASTTNGRVVPLHSLSEPVMTNNALLQWSALALRSAYNLDFNNYQQQMQQASIDFSQSGWGKFKQAMDKEGLLDDVINKKLIMSAVVSGSPVILNQQVVNGFYTWTVQMPVLVSFSSASDKAQTHLLVTMQIQRVSDINAPQGIQISNFTATVSQNGPVNQIGDDNG